MSDGAPPIRALDALPAGAFADIRQRLVLDHCKWDPQIGDAATLAEFPLVLSTETWRQLSAWAEQLTREALTAELALIHAPGPCRDLGLPYDLVQALGPMPPAPRIMRFDFHWTTAGWRFSEVNSDVPGGFTEAGSFTAMLAAHYPETTIVGDPAGAWVGAMAEAAGGSGAIAIVATADHMEDQQVAYYLADRLRQLGFRAPVVPPQLVLWHRRGARIQVPWFRGDLAGVIRFFQGEWLRALPRSAHCRCFFGGAAIPVSNPGCSLLSESKRLPLTFDAVGLEMRLWRSLLPETREVEDAPWQSDNSWILKSAYSNTGDTVILREQVSADRWREIERDVRAHRRRWIAQCRFETVRIPTPRGELYPCIGVYTVDGKAAGIYGRLSTGPVVDFRAVDVAVLVERS